MRYINDTSIAICTSKEDHDEAFKEADNKNIPLVFIRETRKYASVEVDMLTTSASLTDETVEDIREILEQYAQQAYEDPEHKKKPVSRSSSNGLIRICELLIPEARSFAREVEPLVRDTTNHIYSIPK